MGTLDELKGRLLEVDDLSSAASLLKWDQATYMPSGGGASRGRQVATLTRLAHEKLTDPVIGKLLDTLDRDLASRPEDDVDRALVRVTRRAWEQSVRIPGELVSEMSEHTARTYQAWTVARPNDDFELLRPLLEKTLTLSRRMADCFPGYESIADPLIALSDHGVTAKSVHALFTELRGRLVPMVRAIAKRPPADDSCIKQHTPETEQLAFGLSVIKRYGYDFDRGRQDKTHHPFMTKFSQGDVRITTRVREDDMADALFSTLHECGHALYEQGIRAELDGTPLSAGTSSGVHESQSRLWENVVGRSRGFWKHFYPQIQRAFEKQLRNVTDDAFYRAINKVERSLVRVDADEVTYNLHVMLRFDLELDMLEGRVAVKDLPKVWRERFHADFGLTVPSDKDGVLQDVHWFDGPIGGAFQGYTLGNVLSAQFFDAAVKAHPTIPEHIEQGEFAVLRGWLTHNVYQHGASFTAAELVARATGSPMSIEPYMDYLWKKYQPLYGLTEDERR